MAGLELSVGGSEGSAGELAGSGILNTKVAPDGLERGEEVREGVTSAWP